MTIADYLLHAIETLRGKIPPEHLCQFEHLVAQELAALQSIRPTGWNRCFKKPS